MCWARGYGRLIVAVAATQRLARAFAVYGRVTTPYVKERARAHQRGDVLRAIARHLLDNSTRGHIVDHARALLAEANAA